MTKITKIAENAYFRYFLVHNFPKNQFFVHVAFAPDKQLFVSLYCSQFVYSADSCVQCTRSGINSTRLDEEHELKMKKYKLEIEILEIQKKIV